MPGSATEAAVRAAFARQAEWAAKLDSPFMELLCRLLGERLDRSTGAGRQVLDWPGADPFTDALPLRLTGGLHALVRRGDAPRLARCYPPNPLPDEEALWAALQPALAGEALAPWLEGPPQTNEVGRSAVLMSGLLVVAGLFPLPVELLELGASAGLNLMLDRYGYDLGGVRAGNRESPLQLRPEWRGDPPPAPSVRVAARRGVDLHPLDARSGGRLLAYVWPDQARRLAQLEAALAIAAADPPEVEPGDAAEWLEARLAEPRAAGVARVVLHSIAFQYFPEETKSRIVAAMEKAGSAATTSAPLAWLRYEFDDGDEAISLRLRAWPGGEDRLLAYCHPHGSAIEWLAGSESAGGRRI